MYRLLCLKEFFLILAFYLSVLITLSEYTYTHIIKHYFIYFLVVFKIVESFQCIFNCVFFLLMKFVNSIFSIEIYFWIPGKIQGFVLNLRLHFLTFLSGTYLFSTELIASRKLVVSKLTFFYRRLIKI